ncbi:MAG TPA: sigma-54 dependent transcriptional regulator [Thermoanaerobaculaceae bacterium]|nr:sigma-54 dependent transcriptional regulator [Thermoanaerobaculaceae bacterium]
MLVVDDEAAMREVLEARLSGWGYTVLAAADAEEGRTLANSRRPDVVVSDIVLPGMTGLDLLRSLQAGDPDRPVLLITAYGGVDEAVEAMKAGARDFFTKPLDYEKLHAALVALGEEASVRRRAHTLRSALAESAPHHALVGTSPAIVGLRALLETVGASDASVILTGESGTGKELAARTIHEGSRRHAGPFVAINAAAIPEGLLESELFGHEKGAFTGAVGARAGCFEQAGGGTLFLDEIAEMPVALQPKLLRVLEEGRVRRLGGVREVPFDVRVIAATNRDPDEAVEHGLLRRDLYYRLNVFTVPLPPLREREGDVAFLAQHFIDEFNRKHGMAVEGVANAAAGRLESYAWPGNVRELRNVIERAVILARRGFVDTVHLPPFLQRPARPADPTIPIPVGSSAAEAERILILATLEQAGNNKAEAARRLGLDVKTIRNKLRAWGREGGER